MAFFFDIYIKKNYLNYLIFLKEYDYYLNNEKNIFITVYFEDDDITSMNKFVNKIIHIKDFIIETFYNDMGHFLFCTKKYETKEIDFLNFKKIVLKNISLSNENIQNIVRKIDKTNRFSF